MFMMFKTIILLIYSNTADHNVQSNCPAIPGGQNIECSYNVQDVQNNHCDILKPDTPA